MLTWGRGWRSAELLQVGVPVGRVTLAMFREKGTVYLPGEVWTFARQPDGRIHAYAGRGPTGNAQPTMIGVNLSSQCWEVDADSRRYFMTPGLFDHYDVSEDGLGLGSSGLAGFFTKRLQVSLAAAVPLHHQAFILWVARAARRRGSD